MKTIILNGAAGRLGSEIAAHILEEGFALVTVDAYGQAEHTSLDTVIPEGAVLVDCSHHSAATEVCAFAKRHNIPAVIATTGHTMQETALIKETAKSVPLFVSGNTSLGVALLCELARRTAEVMTGADIEIVEIHHNNKLDAPSGTALMLCDAVRAARPELVPVHGRSGQCKREENEIGVHALRMGGVIGDHQVLVSTPSQTITLRHQAHSRRLFAEGALLAAKFVAGQPAGMYDMSGLLGRKG
ncbi:MAG: 4-hydroxy-tetrahydrodipicolinate reductase [Oscillospiraceae bacterium]|nr:4-hydroxy-tetrahydrodipicolinate reductase [Oscillospiraceae bacterium]